ncbi:MAG: Crp/Fnr family transcriptional regulator [Reichenbachiella sp.]|uniref:Crp/Fnr family transcriptional regulator n=1 Tax=Reichenbachiella sp. TaxID=2184521 RepID=UPI0029660EFA|nr:Crp/Fnr family transcriptional regulator [Reichenbachiella sp.]MDW3209980.1 Crp/Fnr family transcriptional regulator [Reichenbachiella sp.]
MKHLIKDIKTTIEITDDDLEKVITRFQSRTFDKSDLIPSIGKTSNHLQFIEEGLVRVYTINAQAKEVTIQIGIEKMWINDLYSYFTQTPSENYIVALEPTTVLQIHRNDLETLYKEVPSMESFFRLKLEKSYVRLHNRTIKQLNNSAEKRYLEFRDKYGHIESRVPQYIIASYLNLSPEHLSKIRNKLTKK